jgi:DnaK suppressor protein
MGFKRAPKKTMTKPTKRTTTPKPRAAKPARAAARPAEKKPTAKRAAAAPVRAAPRKTAPPPPPRRSPHVKLLDAESGPLATGARRLSKPELKEMRQILETRRNEVIGNAQKTLGEGIQLDAAELPDDMDLASSEYLQYFNLRLRGREKTYLEKIERALSRIDDGNFGQCDECGEPIGIERLRVRPEATLCIRCKEAQEREEQQFG